MTEKTPAKNSKQRRANNELIFKNINLKTSKLVDAVFNEHDKIDVPIEFYCECSNTDCIEKVSLTLADFEKIRRNPSYFLIKPGHNQPDIEELVDGKPNYAVVEKHQPLRPVS